MLKKAGIVVAVLLVTAIGLGQENRLEVSLSAAAVVSKQTKGNGVVQSPTASLGIIGSLRVRLTGTSALEFSYGRTKNTQKYTSDLDFRIPATISEFTGAYVFTPFHTSKFQPFLFGGAGALVFNPNDSFINGIESSVGEKRQIRPGYLYGGGVDYHLVSRVSLRVQYRGLFYSAPNFKSSSLFTGGMGHMAEPAAGLVFKF